MSRSAFTRLTRTRLLILLGLIYLGLFVAFDFLRFPPEKDEIHFWPTALSFSRAWIPSLDRLRGYQELSTPLAFVVFGALEHMFHGGIAAGRLLNLVLSFGVAAAVVTAGDDTNRSARAAVGLLLFPYFLGVAPYLYTDVIAAGFVLLGLIFHLKRKWLVSAVCWSLAIATRQYTLAFPLGIAAYELSSIWRDGRSEPARWLAPVAGASTMGLWFWFFGGPAPVAELARQEVGLNRLQYLHPSHAVYLLVCVAVFYVIPEFVLFPPSLKLRRTGPRSPKLQRTNLVGVLIASATVLAALLFAPLGNHWGPATMGVFDQLMVALLDSIPRALLYGGLAALAAIRFSERSLEAFLVAANAGVLILAYTMWEKYALPLLVCLWYLRARLVELKRPLKESCP